MKRTFIVMECDEGWCIVPAVTPKASSIGDLSREVKVRWDEMRAYGRLSQALWHLEELVKSQKAGRNG